MKQYGVCRLGLLMAAATVCGYGSVAQAQPGGRQVNILTILPQRPGADYAVAINTQLAAGKVVYLPNTGKPYSIGDAIRVSAPGAGLVGQPGTILAFTSHKTIFSITAPNVTFQNITFDGRALGASPKPEAYCIRPNFRWIGGGMIYGGPLFLQEGCNNAVISGIKYIDSSASAITVQAANVTIEKSEFENNVGFGINATKGATNFRFNSNWTNANGLELIGISHGAVGGEIIGNRAIGTGDNCFSISGDRVRVENNVAKRCLGHGIGLYGDGNTVVHNTIQDNGQEDNPDARPVLLWNGTVKPIYHCPGYTPRSYSGIKLIGAAGGHGTQNTVANNIVSDDQPRPTQGGIDVRTTEGNSVAANSVGRNR